jgi:hypothetical protein
VKVPVTQRAGKKPTAMRQRLLFDPINFSASNDEGRAWNLAIARHRSLSRSSQSLLNSTLCVRGSDLTIKAIIAKLFLIKPRYTSSFLDHV